MVNDVEKVVIDEDRKHVLTKVVKTKKGVRKVESDHNPIITKINLNWSKETVKERIELFNLKNKECQAKFKIETSTESNKGMLSSVFDEEGDLNSIAQTFINRLKRWTSMEEILNIYS